uniref:IPPc domain-containing protein n=1 Tax=Heterorhabditis bacteriophora TaxID=37862 RepID=A0A1I7XJD4_HETBA
MSGHGILITNFGFSTFACLCILINLLCGLAISIVGLFFYRHQCIVNKLTNKQFYFCILFDFLVLSSLTNAFLIVSHTDSSQWSKALEKVNPKVVVLLKIPNIYYIDYSEMAKIILFSSIIVLFLLVTPFFFAVIRSSDSRLGLQILNNIAMMMISNYGILATLFLIYFNDAYRKFLFGRLTRKARLYAVVKQLTNAQNPLMYEPVVGTVSVNSPHRVTRSLSQPARINYPAEHRYTEVDDHTWKYTTDSNKFESSVVGFGSVPIPSYDNIAKLPDRKISIRVLTWNINEKPVKILGLIVDQLINIPRNSIEDVISIALQEISPGTKTFHEDALQMVAKSLIETHSIYFSYRVWSQMVLVFIKKSHIKFAIQPLAKFVSSAAVPKPVRTKGAIGVCFRLYQRWIVIIACHLSHASVQQRVQDYHKIMRSLKFPTLMDFKGSDDILHADVVLWTGDLNFRVNVDTGVTWTNNYITRQRDAEKALQTDELQIVRQKRIEFCTGVVVQSGLKLLLIIVFKYQVNQITEQYMGFSSMLTNDF